MINVAPHHQRQGVGEGMVKHARDIAVASKGRIRAPSRAYSETDQGAAFAESMIKRGLFPEE
jgi:GNAT superfamily N-acetyltransferase